MELLLGKQNFTHFSATDPTDDLITLNAVHGAFYGSSMRPERLEGLIAAHVPKSQIKDVSDVYAYKWWDYRRMSPGHSFTLFADRYYRHFRLAAKKMIAHRKRNQYQAALIGVSQVQFQAESIWDRDHGHITGMFKAMLTADALGIPYDRFCALAFQTAIDTAWKRLPNPSQLYSPKMGAQILDAWDTLSGERLFIADHPIYLVENYAGTPLQDEYRVWLINHIKRRDKTVPALSQVVYGKPQLPEALAQQHFSQQALNRARLMAA